uniref:FHA domain-containing protein n=1 Tax=Ditylenchus dipsaci TaxID=166011 RepID=A0A915EAG5_9BILA
MLQNAPNVHFASNPCRITFKGQIIVVCRDDLVEKLCRLAIHVPDNTKDIPQHFCDTIWSQRHFSPLPLHFNAVLPQFDYLFHLWPLPDVLIVADKFKSFVSSGAYNCRLTINPGSFLLSNFEFQVYYPATGKVEAKRKIPVTRSEDQAVKIGRAVVRLQPAVNNGIFDCKVLSRNHAIMWYEDEQFLIKDTRSSNGTFVNNDRLSNSGEESTARPLRSGDILQLGVEIVDNTKKVASGCVTCIVRLINERGEECFDNRSNSLIPMPAGRSDQIPLKYTLIRNDKLFIMDQYVKEARFRENLLGQKLQSLEEQLAQAEEALQTSWQALINEEQLLSRIEMLESQLSIVLNKNPNSDEIRREIQDIYEDRAKAELVAKDSLRKAEEQVFETSMRLHDAEMGL